MTKRPKVKRTKGQIGTFVNAVAVSIMLIGLLGLKTSVQGSSIMSKKKQLRFIYNLLLVNPEKFPVNYLCEANTLMFAKSF